MSVETKEDLENLKRVGRIVADTIRLLRKAVRPGVTTSWLDSLARKYFESFGARSAPELDYNFPGATCISVNHEVAHGIPGDRVIQQGDMVNFDVSLELNGYYADAGYTVVVGAEDGDEVKDKLCKASSDILMDTIKSIRANDKLNKIGYSIENLARHKGFTVIKNLSGHGTGRKLHEEPVNILNYGERKDRRRLKNGSVLAIETFISTKSEYVLEEKNGWTLSCPDRSLVAQFEHTVVITNGEPIVLTA